MPEHQTLLWLPDALRDAGINFAELHGWKTNQSGYYWTNENNQHFGYNGDPVGWVWHHTASLGFTPYVKNAQGQTKANLWMGLARGNRLYQLGNGPPTVVLASGGPGNFTEGSGRRNVLTNYVALDNRFPGPQKLADDSPKFFGNRYYGSTEVIHSGDGSPLHPGVWEMQVQVAALMSQHYGWSEFRHIGHLDHTKRKVDQRFQQGQPYTIAAMQADIAALMEDDMNYKKIVHGDWGEEGLGQMVDAGTFGDVPDRQAFIDYWLDPNIPVNGPPDSLQHLVEVVVGWSGVNAGGGGEGTPHPHEPEPHDHPSHTPQAHTHPFIGQTGSN